MSEVDKRSKKVLYDNMSWLLTSDIQIKTGPNKGALYGWMNLKPKSFPFVYSEITGYAITCFCWMASEFGNQSAFVAAKEASEWVRRNIHSNLLTARPPAIPSEPNELSSIFYSFDNTMVIIGMLNLYKTTRNPSDLRLVETMTQALLKHFFDGEKLVPRLDSCFKPINPTEDAGLMKWSTIPGAYHCKFSLGLLELSKLTGNNEYARISDSLCDYSKKTQKGSGEFVTNPGSDIVYIHPHLYACEGLIYSGIKQSNENHYAAGLKGIKWAMDQVNLNRSEGLFRNTGSQSIEQSDCTAQLLRLSILCQSDLENGMKKSELTKKIRKLHQRLLEFYISEGEGQGAMKYQLPMKTACSWCTMFSMQALKLWASPNSKELRWMDYFV